MSLRKFVTLGLLCASLLAGAVREAGAQHRPPGQDPRGPDKAPKLGEAAPDFTLRSLDDKQEVKLSKLVGKRPIVLVFGSYT
ncbi:MAG: hypothetical protein HYZ53_20760 [Planctomycetes bacterium]|nr:hypothetical protein [Planctomycetota bacterium]